MVNTIANRQVLQGVLKIELPCNIIELSDLESLLHSPKNNFITKLILLKG